MRPKIICHMVSSVDGRLMVDRYSKPAKGIDGAALRQQYDSISESFQPDGWVVGRKTMDEVIEDFPKKERIAKPAREDLRGTYVADRKGHNIAVCHYGQDNAYGDHIVAVVGE